MHLFYSQDYNVRISEIPGVLVFRKDFSLCLARRHFKMYQKFHNLKGVQSIHPNFCLNDADHARGSHFNVIIGRTDKNVLSITSQCQEVSRTCTLRTKSMKCWPRIDLFLYPISNFLDIWNFIAGNKQLILQTYLLTRINTQSLAYLFLRAFELFEKYNLVNFKRFQFWICSNYHIFTCIPQLWF